jgi:hypothetical protein
MAKRVGVNGREESERRLEMFERKSWRATRVEVKEVTN